VTGGRARNVKLWYVHAFLNVEINFLLVIYYCEYCGVSSVGRWWRKFITYWQITTSRTKKWRTYQQFGIFLVLKCLKNI